MKQSSRRMRATRTQSTPSFPTTPDISATFNRQRNTAESLYGKQLKMPVFTAEEIAADLKPFLEYYPERDRGIIADRVITCVLERQKC